MGLPLVSIVTPSFQQASFLERTIGSVLDQDYPRIEYLILDGGSTDGSVEVIRRYADRLAFWTSGRDAGQSDAIANGWERATGEIVAWINSDDFYYPGAVRRAVDALIAEPDAVFAYGPCDLLDERTGLRRPLRVAPLGLSDLLLRRSVLAQPATFMRADAVRACGGLDRGLRYVMDYDLFLRMLTIGAGIFVPGPPLACYRLHPAAHSRAQAVGFAVELERVLRRYFAGPIPRGVARLRRPALAQAYLAGARAALLTRGDALDALRWGLRALGIHPRSAATALLSTIPRFLSGSRPPS